MNRRNFLSLVAAAPIGAAALVVEPARTDFKLRQEGLKLMRDEGIISAKEWRDLEGLSPV